MSIFLVDAHDESNEGEATHRVQNKLQHRDSENPPP